MRTDGQTRQTLIVAFRCFSNMPHKHVLLKAIRYLQKNRDSVVGVVTRRRVRWSGYRKGQKLQKKKKHP
jgi:predicted DCC family thiol-disulfide oxidoreductase YuxK